MKIILKLHSKKKLTKNFILILNFYRHLKWNEKKFNGTLNETRFGLKARVRI
jgi:hypothetical protein